VPRLGSICRIAKAQLFQRDASLVILVLILVFDFDEDDGKRAVAKLLVKLFPSRELGSR
jgi:hypothetical protein